MTGLRDTGNPPVNEPRVSLRRRTHKLALVATFMFAGILVENTWPGFYGYVFGGNLVGISFGAAWWYQP